MRSSHLRWAAFGATVVLVAVLAVACSQHSMSVTSPLGPDANAFSTAAAASAPSLNGNASAIPAYYDSALFTIHFVELPPNAEQTILAKNHNINNIWQSDPGLPGGKPFISVIDAIPADGMNPLWRETQITFNTGFTPRQLFSDNEILAAAAGSKPEITLTPTTEVYTCPVVAKPASFPPNAKNASIPTAR